ncbi:MAG: glycosyltransferase [Bacteroidetes bacterium]|nr:glycosyltransferase [Bacteroidota bacterium]
MISILILTHNRANDLLLLLISLARQKNIEQLLCEIIILNNASTESYVEVLSFIESHPELRVRYVFSEENTGVARGRNLLMSQAKGDYLLTIDDDMEFPSTDSLVMMSAIFDQEFFKKANAAVVTFRVVYQSNGQVQKSVFPHKNYEEYKFKKQFLTLYFAGGANIMKRSILDKTGLFPTDFFYGMEEYDLCYRILDNDYTIGYDDSVTIEHKESPYGRQPNFQKLRMQWVNKSRVAYRYLPFRYFLTTSIFWSGKYIMDAPTHLFTYMKGWWDILRIPFHEKRTPINTNTFTYLRNVKARLWY